MKILKILVLCIFSFIFLSSTCKKENNKPADELSKLPAATQTGKRTFGCLVNGQAFRPGNSGLFLGPKVSATTDGNIIISGIVEPADGSYLKSVKIHVTALTLKTGDTIKLTQLNVAGESGGSYTVYAAPKPAHEYDTDQTFNGQLILTRYDPINHIISGTFWFDAVDTNGDKVEVRSGRFDLPLL